MNVTIETERLLIRNMTPEDAEAAFVWCGDPEVNKYLTYPLYQSVDQVRTWLTNRKVNEDPNNYDFGFVLKETGQLIGSGGLIQKEEGIWILGYCIRKDMWGHGYVPEAMQAILEEVQKTHHVKALEGWFAKENYKSRRVMEKLGMSYVKDYEYQKADGSQTFAAAYYRRSFE